MRRAAIPVAVLVGGASAALTIEAWPEALPDWSAWALFLAGPFLVGFLGGGRAIVVFTAVLLAGTVIVEVAFWDNDPLLHGIDDIPPLGSAVLMLLFAVPIAVLGLIAALVTFRDRRRPLMEAFRDATR